MITILSASFANTAHDAAIVNSVETGLTLISAADHPDLWGDVMAAHPSDFAPPPSARQMSRKAWNDALDAAGKLEAWLALIADGLSLIADGSLKQKDVGYLLTGGQYGYYLETNSSLIRLAAKAGVDISAVFDSAG